MPKSGVRYRTVDQAILGIVLVSRDADLMLNFDPATEGMIEVPGNHGILSAQLQWRIIDGVLEQKSIVTITASKVAFLANGVDSVALTLIGLVAPAILSLGGGLTVGVSPADANVTITSDLPRLFVAELIDNLHWSALVSVEAV